jgi:hypothetical protein
LVLEEALDAMASEPSLDDPSGSADGAGSETAQASAASDPLGEGNNAAASSEPSLDDVRAALDRADANAAEGGELAALNRELNESLAQFDSALAGARASRQQAIDETGTGSVSEQGDAVALYEDPLGGAGTGETAEGSYAPPMPSGGAANGSATDGTSQSGDGLEGTASASTSNVPNDIPSGEDDDVVARQIREAAMKETDPELREKLWEEYRKYTNAQKRES